jgi:hypothetical protein
VSDDDKGAAIAELLRKMSAWHGHVAAVDGIDPALWLKYETDAEFHALVHVAAELMMRVDAHER